jgi:hypothetical protein
MILIQQYFTSSRKERQDEIDFCLQQNLNCHMLESVVLLNEKEYSFDKFVDSEKKLQVVPEHIKRLTFFDAFTYANQHYQEGTLIIVSNSDIFFTDGELNKISSNLKDNDFYCLSRWNYNKADIERSQPFHASCAQDTWIGKVPIRINDKMNFSVGALWGCDNVIAYLLKSEGYNVINPCHSIKTYHVHQNQYYEQTFDTTKRLPPPYFLVEPRSL